jgi:hypothetical protein
LKDVARAGVDFFWKKLVGSSSNTPNENTSWLVCDSESALGLIASFGNTLWVVCDNSAPNLGVIDIFDVLSFLTAGNGCALALGVVGGYDLPSSTFLLVRPHFSKPLDGLLPTPFEPAEPAELLLEFEVGTVPSEPSPNSALSLENMLTSSSIPPNDSWMDSESNLANKLGTSLFVSSSRVIDTLRLRIADGDTFVKLRPWRPDPWP